MRSCWLLLGLLGGLGACGDKGEPVEDDTSTPVDTAPPADDTGGEDCEDPQIWYRDADEDGYGEDITGVEDCDPGEGWSTVPGDCDDTARAINPEGQEVCDATGADEDCDGLVDDEDDSVLYDDGAPVWFEDWDGDGHADADDPEGRRFCEAPESGYLEEAGGDCDDTDEAINPDAFEQCWNLVDEDCDGSDACELDGSVLGVDAVGTELVGSFISAGSRAGERVVLADLDGDGVDQLVTSSWVAASGAGALWLVSETPTEDVVLQDVSSRLSALGSEDALGRSLAVLPDLEGDGVDAVLIGAPGQSDLASGAGAAYLLAGPFSGDGSMADARVTWTSSVSDAALGTALVSVDDLDGDTVSDVFAGAPGAGSAYLFSGALTGSADVSQAVATVSGEVGLGCALRGRGDLDGDGVQELVIGLCGESSSVGIFSAVPSGGVQAEDADVTWTLGSAESTLTLSTGGDLDGDGVHDLVLGRPDSDEVLVLTSAASGGGSADSAAWSVLGSAESGVALGTSLWSEGDLDGDGVDDLVLGATGASPSVEAAGGVYLLLGPHSAGSVAVDTAAELVLGGESADQGVGAALAAGQLDEGALELVLGVPGDNGDAAGGKVGALRILWGLGG